MMAETFPNTEAYISATMNSLKSINKRVGLHPRIIITIVKIFSRSVVAETFPNPMEVIVDRVK
jgi:hypothetical protein